MPGENNCPDSCPAHSGVVAEQENTKEFIGKIMNNHLPHIEAALDKNTEAINNNHMATKNWLIGILVSVVMLLVGTSIKLIIG